MTDGPTTDSPTTDGPTTEPPATWTIDRLARLAATALAAGAPTQPNGRIREVPDVRTIRWYTSIGLLDRPAAMRGRTALYAREHLAQLVAIKRLQASGLTVAAVQERLLGADKSVVEDIAKLPTDLSALIAQVDANQAVDGEAAPSTPPRFWATPAAPPTAAPPGTAETAAAPPPTTVPTAAATPAAETPAAATAAPTASETPTPTDLTPLVPALRLTTGVTLLLPPGRVPDAAARAAIAEAARPLLDLLDRLGLSEA